MEASLDTGTQCDASHATLDVSEAIPPIGEDVSSVAAGAEASQPTKLELPSVATADELVTNENDENGNGENHENVDDDGKLVLPVVAGVDVAKKHHGSQNSSNGYVESVILSSRSSSDGNTPVEGLCLPKIEVKSLQTGAATGGGAPMRRYQHAPPCYKTRAEIIADNAHPKCFGAVGASGLSRIFTSGSFCPGMSSQPMAVKNGIKLPEAASLVVRNFKPKTNDVPKFERSKSLMSWSKQRSKTEMPAIRTSKVSLFSRGGERIRNMVFVPTASGLRDDWGKSETSSPRNTVNSSAARVPKLTDRYNSFVRDDAEKQRGKDGKSADESSNSDDLTPSETGVMDSKIQDWFISGKNQHPKPKTHHGVRGKKKTKSRNIWDPGMQPAIHRGLASSMLKPTASIGNYMSDVTASRFPKVVTRQIVVTR